MYCLIVAGLMAVLNVPKQWIKVKSSIFTSFEENGNNFSEISFKADLHTFSLYKYSSLLCEIK